MSRISSIVALLLSVVLVAVACGSDPQEVASGSADDPISAEADGGNGDNAEPLPGADEPIPVEPDGGIGDGAEPLPGAEDPVDEGTWHGEEVAITNCPGTEWKRVQASAFSFSVPTNFVEADLQPIDSEIGIWDDGNDIEVSFDYGWYSGSIADRPGAENEAIDYSGIIGEQTIIRGETTNQIGVYFAEVAQQYDEWAKLGMVVNFADPNDEIIGRCIVGSISWDS